MSRTCSWRPSACRPCWGRWDPREPRRPGTSTPSTAPEIRQVKNNHIFTWPCQPSLIKKKIKFSSHIRKFRMEQLQSHIWLTATSYVGKYLRISSYIWKPFLIYDFATISLWISLYMRKIYFLFYQCSIQVFQTKKHLLRLRGTWTMFLVSVSLISIKI